MKLITKKELEMNPYIDGISSIQEGIDGSMELNVVNWITYNRNKHRLDFFVGSESCSSLQNSNLQCLMRKHYFI